MPSRASRHTKTSLEIAQAHELIPIAELAAGQGLLPEEVEPYGRYKAKISLSVLERLNPTPEAKLVCVTGMTPTRAGEGNTTTVVSLTDGLGTLGKRPVACLRQGSLGPVFGMKGGAAGGGHAQVMPMEELNLHFTGDVHAIGAANNLLAAMIDASILHGNPHDIDALRIPWRRAVDMNDRALRRVTIGLRGRANGYPRETGFDITAASEVMAITSVAADLRDLRRRLGRITAGYSRGEGNPVTAEDLRAAGAMTVLLKDALKPNLAQTLEGQPALVHCGPLGITDHGNNSLIADLVAIRLGEYVVTECGFGSDMGLEKFFNLVCRVGHLTPAAAVLVLAVRAVKHHGRIAEDGIAGRAAGLSAIKVGMANVRRHLGIIQSFGVPAVVAINRRADDTNEELELLERLAVDAGAFAACVHEGFTRGGPGAAELAGAVVKACERPSEFRYLYADDEPIQDKVEAIARRVYGAQDLFFYPEAEQKLADFTAEGLAGFPVCIAKTHLSLSADSTLLGAPEGFTLPVRDIRAYTGAGWLVALCGEVNQMPGLGKTPAAVGVDIDRDGRIVGLF
jgi:formyltetrahydrofolate synthetase